MKLQSLKYGTRSEIVYIYECSLSKTGIKGNQYKITINGI